MIALWRLSNSQDLQPRARPPGRWHGAGAPVVVLDAGDIIFPFKDYVRSQIRLEIEGGYIRKVSGGFDADLLSEFFAQYQDPEAYAISHLGWGLSPRARWTQLALMGKGTNGNDARSFAGICMSSPSLPKSARSMGKRPLRLSCVGTCKRKS